MKKILSIDDEPTMLSCIKNILNAHGYDLTTTSDPEEGINFFKENEDLKLVLLDIRMPIKNGFEIYSEMMQIRKVPAMFVTAYPRSFNADDDDMVEMWQEEFADGTTDIIYKPFEMKTLIEKVQSLIGAPEEE